MITAKIIGKEEVIVNIKRVLPSLRAELKLFTEAFRIDTVQYIQSEKLSGQVLFHRTGKLKDSIAGGSYVKGFDVHIGTNVEYAAAHEFGREPYRIVPKTKKALRFEIGGETVFAKSVNHPGQKKRLFLHTSLKERKEAFREGLLKTTEQAINK